MPSKTYENILYILKEQDYYKILNVNDNADITEITKAYKNFAKLYHPDVSKVNDESEKEEIEQLFKKITSAYNILKDPDKRKDYDYQKRLNEEYKKTLAYSQPAPTDNVVYAKPKPKPITLNINVNKSSFSNPETQDNESKDKAKNEHAENLYNTALGKYKSGSLEAAILDLQTCIVINSKIAKYHSTLGLMLEKKGWESYAQSEFKISLKLDPKDKIANEHIKVADSAPVQSSKQAPANSTTINTPPPRVKTQIIAQSKQKEKQTKGLFNGIKGIIDNIFSPKKN